MAEPTKLVKVDDLKIVGDAVVNKINAEIETVNETINTEIETVNETINTHISTAYTVKGSVATVADLVEKLADAKVGDVWNVAKAGEVTAEFIEYDDAEDAKQAKIPKGANVVVVEVEDGSEKTKKFDVLSGFVDLSGYAPMVTEDGVTTIGGWQIATDQDVKNALAEIGLTASADPPEVQS